MKIFVTAAILSLLAAAPRPASAPTSSPSANPNCGEAVWTILDQKGEKTIFNGTAACTTVEFNGRLLSILIERGMSLEVVYDAAGRSTCGGPHITVTLAGVSAPPGVDQSYMAGQGNVSPPGTSCEFSIDDLPHRAGVVRGGLKAVLGRCLVVGGCGKASDWDLASVNGSFNAHYRGD